MVIAYRGGPLHEYLDETSTFFADFDDLLTLTKQVERAVDLFETNRQAFAQQNKVAQTHIKPYSLKNEEKSVLEAWTLIMQNNN